MPNHHCKVPLTDVQNAFRYCRAHQKEWGIKQLGIIGFSAGGHLAASASTLWVDAVTRPDFSVLVYPVITLEQDVTHKGTRSNLTDNKIENNGVWFPTTILVDNSIVRLSTSTNNNNYAYFYLNNGGGFAKNLTVKNSTFYNTTDFGFRYFVRYGGFGIAGEF